MVAINLRPIKKKVFPPDLHFSWDGIEIKGSGQVVVGRDYQIFKYMCGTGKLQKQRFVVITTCRLLSDSIRPPMADKKRFTKWHGNKNKSNYDQFYQSVSPHLTPHHTVCHLLV